MGKGDDMVLDIAADDRVSSCWKLELCYAVLRPLQRTGVFSDMHHSDLSCCARRE